MIQVYYVQKAFEMVIERLESFIWGYVGEEFLQVTCVLY